MQFNRKIPSIFHVTHWKAGSQWVHKILQQVAPERIIAPKIGKKQFFEEALVQGGIYPTVYVTRDEFYSVALPENFRYFIVIRDLRDTLISGYYSIRYSHPVISHQLESWRNKLETLSLEAGLITLMDEWLPQAAEIQRSWIQAGEDVIRYEDLLDHDKELMEELIIDKCQIAISPKRLRDIIIANQFHNLTGGRKRGEEDIHFHERKGIAGDWQNYFSPLLTYEFRERFGDLISDLT